MTFIATLLIGMQTTLMFTGPATISSYQTLVQSLTYANLAMEPFPNNRSITIAISDGAQSDTAVITIIVEPSNDNEINIQAVSPMVTYTEGDVSVRVGELSGLTITDGDLNPIVTEMTVALSGALESEDEFLVLDTSAIGGEGLVNGASISLQDSSSLDNYQVRKQ